MVLTFESVEENLWCDHSNETFLPVLLHGTICFLKFQNEIWKFLLNFALGQIWQ